MKHKRTHILPWTDYCSFGHEVPVDATFGLKDASLVVVEFMSPIMVSPELFMQINEARCPCIIWFQEKCVFVLRVATANQTLVLKKTVVLIKTCCTQTKYTDTKTYDGCSYDRNIEIAFEMCAQLRHMQSRKHKFGRPYTRESVVQLYQPSSLLSVVLSSVSQGYPPPSFTAEINQPITVNCGL